MLPKNRRIPTLWFKERYRRITTQKSPHISMSVFEAHKKDSPTCFACVISKKGGLTAVKRNSIRRRAYAILEELLPSVKGGLYCTLSLSKEVDGMSYDELKGQITNLLRKSNVV
ncbi:MAG: ribonuclease P protein component [Parcubacteria group bacterium]|nr:ribonuclease P protein component [Parcubacteria group bacterium]